MPRPRKSLCQAPACPGVSKCPACRRIRMRSYMASRRQSANKDVVPANESANKEPVSANIDTNIVEVPANIPVLADSTVFQRLGLRPASGLLHPQPRPYAPPTPAAIVSYCAFPRCKSLSSGSFYRWEDGEEHIIDLCAMHSKGCKPVS